MVATFCSTNCSNIGLHAIYVTGFQRVINKAIKQRARHSHRFGLCRNNFLVCQSFLLVSQLENSGGYNKQYPNQASNEQNTDYLHTVLILQAICLVLWAFTGLLVFGQRFFDWDTVLLADKSIDIIWLAFSAIPYFLGYFAIHQPEIFKIAKTSLAQVNILPNKVSTENALVSPKLPEVLPEIAPQADETPVLDIEKDANHEQLIASWKEKIDEFMN
jgi:hypothetical protein